MPSTVVAEAFKAQLGNPWNGIPVGNMDTWPTPPEVNAFLVVQYPVVNAEKPVLGRRYFEEGAARLVLNVKRDIGIDQGLVWADTLAALFRTVKFGGVETFAPSAPIIDDNLEDGNWLSFAVIVPYRYQFDG